MSHVAITFILVVLAANAKVQIKDNLTNPMGRENFEGKRKFVN